MKFDKELYQKRRQPTGQSVIFLQGREVPIPIGRKRGQGDKPKQTFHPKGEVVEYETREGKKAEYPNDQGHQMVRTRQGVQMINRADSRRRVINRGYTKGIIKPEVKPANYKTKLPLFPPDLPNHDRHIIRKETRQVMLEKARELDKK